jgi:hypothetical protein
MKAMKRILGIVGWISSAFLFLLITGVILLQTSTVKNYLLSQAQNYVRRHFGAELRIGRYDFNLLKGSLSAEDVSLRSISSGLAPLLHIKKAYAYLDSHVLLEGVDIRVVVDRSGHSNLPEFGGGGGSGSLPVKMLEIKHGSLKIEDQRQQIRMDLPSWRVMAKSEGSGTLSRIIFDADKNGSMQYMEKQFEIGDLAIEAKISSAELEIQRIHVMASGFKAEGAGIIRDFSNPVIDLKIDADIDLEKAAALIGPLPGVKGRAVGIVNLTGPLQNLQIRGKLQGDITSFNLPGWTRAQIAESQIRFRYSRVE